MTLALKYLRPHSPRRRSSHARSPCCRSSQSCPRTPARRSALPAFLWLGLLLYVEIFQFDDFIFLLFFVSFPGAF